MLQELKDAFGIDVACELLGIDKDVIYGCTIQDIS